MDWLWFRKWPRCSQPSTILCLLIAQLLLREKRPPPWDQHSTKNFLLFTRCQLVFARGLQKTSSYCRGCYIPNYCSWSCSSPNPPQEYRSPESLVQEFQSLQRILPLLSIPAFPTCLRQPDY